MTRVLILITFLWASALSIKAEETPPLRHFVWQALSEVQVELEAKKYAAGFEMLDSILSGRELNSYELANVYNLYAYAFYAQSNYEQALLYYEKVVAQPNIPRVMYLNTLFTVAQLNFVLERWQSGVDTLKLWMKLNDNPHADTYALLATGYYQLGRYEEAVASIEIALAATESAGKAPKEHHYKSAEQAYRRLGDLTRANELARERQLIYPVSGPGIVPPAMKQPVPTVSVAPIWPHAKRGVEGYCTLSYSLTTEGKIYDVVVSRCYPEGVFEEVSLSAMQKFQFPSYEGVEDEYRLTGLTRTFVFSKASANKTTQ